MVENTYHEINIFYLNHNPTLAAQSLLDLHLKNTIDPLVQMLANVYFNETATAPPPEGYTAKLLNHPCSIWVAEEFKHWNWAYMYTHAAMKEFEARFGAPHPKLDIVNYMINHIPVGWMSNRNFWDPPIVVPAEFKTRISGAMASYRLYYRIGCRQLHAWTGHPVPPLWLVDLRDAHKRVTALVDECVLDLMDVDQYRDKFMVDDKQWTEIKEVAVKYANGLDAVSELNSEAEHLLELAEVTLIEPDRFKPTDLNNSEWEVVKYIAHEKMNGRDPLEEPKDWNYTNSRV